LTYINLLVMLRKSITQTFASYTGHFPGTPNIQALNEQANIFQNDLTLA
jgi:hypothetical protein